MRKDEIVSGTEKPEYDGEMKETVHQEVKGGREREKQWEVGVVLARALGLLSVVTGEGGTPLLLWLLMDC